MSKHITASDTMTPVTLETKAFTRELEWTARFIEKKSTIPILTNVLFRKIGDFLYLSGTDLEVGGVTSVETLNDTPDFEFTAPAALLIKYLKKVDERTISLTPEFVWTAERQGPHAETCTDDACACDLKREITNTAMRLEHGPDGSMRIDGMLAFSYPELPAAPPAVAELSGFETAVPRAVIAISNKASRFTLNGALLEIEGTAARLVSTDGHRLGVVDLKTSDYANVNALIPQKALIELARLGDSSFFSADENHAFFQTGQRTIITRKLTGSFPDYRRVLAQRQASYMTSVSVAPLRKVLDRVALFADERSHAIAVSVNGAMGISVKGHDRGADGKVKTDWLVNADGAPCELATHYASGFNAEYLAEFLKASDVSDVCFRFGNCTESAEWTAPGWRYVLMPMRDAANASNPTVAPAVVEAWLEEWPIVAPAVMVTPVEFQGWAS